jgi:hypothetical protein
MVTLDDEVRYENAAKLALPSELYGVRAVGTWENWQYEVNK